MKNLKEYITKKDIIIVLIFILIIGAVSYKISAAYKTDIAKQQLLLETKEKEVETANILAAKRSKIEIIKNQIANANDLKDDFKKDKEQAIKIEEANIWYIRCLEAEGQLELWSKQYELECYPYQYDIMFDSYNEDVYKDLEKFATYNLEQTKFELGL